MARIIMALLAAICSVAYTQTPGGDVSLPQIAVGAGPSWTRGDTHATSADVSIAVRLGGTDGYSWSEMSTPIARVSAAAGPLPSTLTTGGAYRVAQSTGGAVSLWGIGQAGLNSTSGSYSLALTGSAGISIRVPRTRNWFVFPYAKLARPQRGADGALIGGIAQPGFMLMYGLGAK